MGGGAVLEGVNQMAKPLLDVLVGDLQGLESLGLHLRGVDSDGATPQLRAVEDDVVSPGPAVGLVGEHLVLVFDHGGGEGVVHGLVPAFLLGPLEHGELGDPQELEVVGIQDAQLLGALDAQGAQGGKDHLVLGVPDDEHQVPVLGPGPLQDGGVLLVGEELLVGGCHLPVHQTGPGQALGLVGFDEVPQLVDLLPGEVLGVAVHVDQAHRAPGLDGAGKHPEAAALHDVGDVFQLKAKPQVGLVGAETVHGLPPGHPQEGGLDVHVQHLFEHPLQETLLDGLDLLLVQEGHLQVDLGELRLPVGPEVLVPEAPGDLEVPVKPCQHQQLLVLLGGLGQGIELPRVDPGGHQVVPGPFGGGLGEDGGFNLQKALLVEVVPADLHDLVAQGDHPLHIRPAEVQVAVLQPDGVLHVGVLHDLEGRGGGLGQQAQLGDLHLDVAGGQVGVLGLPLPHQALGGDDILPSEGGRLLKKIPGGAVVKGQLEQAGAVPQVHEDQAAQVALALDPAADGNLLADVGRGEGAAVAGAAKVLQIVHGFRSLHCRFVL